LPPQDVSNLLPAARNWVECKQDALTAMGYMFSSERKEDKEHGVGQSEQREQAVV